VSVRDEGHREVSDPEHTTEGYSFDSLARGMANGAISRRQALKLVSAALLGFGSLGLLGGVAGAKSNHGHHHSGAHGASKGGKHKGGKHNKGRKNKGGNSTCAHFCQGLLSSAARGKCVSDAAHGKGLCFQCGPKGTNQGLCGQVCCSSGQTCDTTNPNQPTCV
jgi:hypothetical protein